MFFDIPSRRLISLSLYKSVKRRHFQWSWTTFQISRSRYYLTLNIAETVRRYIQIYLQLNTNRELHTPYSRMSFWMTLSDLEWLCEIFNDTKHRGSRGLSATAELVQVIPGEMTNICASIAQRVACKRGICIAMPIHLFARFRQVVAAYVQRRPNGLVNASVIWVGSRWCVHTHKSRVVGCLCPC